jgi:hypothetical protein
VFTARYALSPYINQIRFVFKGFCTNAGWLNSVQWRQTFVSPRHGKSFSDFRLPPRMLMRSALFWGVTQRRVVILYESVGTTYRSRLQGFKKSNAASLDFLTLEDGTDTLPRNVGKGLPLDAAWHPRRSQISAFFFLPFWHLEIWGDS